MARRASSGVNTGALIIGAIVFILILGGGYWFLNRKPSGFDAPELDIEQALPMNVHQGLLTVRLHLV